MYIISQGVRIRTWIPNMVSPVIHVSKRLNKILKSQYYL